MTDAQHPTGLGDGGVPHLQPGATATEGNEAVAEQSQVPVDENFHHRLSSFFRVYEPTQLKVIDQWVRNWAGREAELMSALVEFHGPEPKLSSRAGMPRIAMSHEALVETSCRFLLEQTFLLYAPERVAEVEPTLAKWEGQFPLLLERLQRQVAYRDSVLKTFREQMPDRVHEAPVLLRQWLGREMELLKLLNKSGGGSKLPDRPPPPTSSSSTGNNASSLHSGDNGRVPLPFRSYREQLLHFYRMYNPERVGDVDIILEQYAGRETALFRKLYKKYCNEPPADTRHAHVRGSSSATAARGDGEEAAAAGSPAGAAAGSNEPRASVRHLMAASSLESTAELDEFVRSFEGSDAELAWALRYFCREGIASPPSTSARSKRDAVSRQIAALESRSNAVHGELRRDLFSKYGAADLHDDAHSIDDAEDDGEEELAQRRPPQNQPRTEEELAAALRASDAVSTNARVHSMQVVLSHLGLGHLAGTFVDQDLSLEMLPTLTGTDLRDMGIEPESERRSIVLKLRQLGGMAQQPR